MQPSRESLSSTQSGLLCGILGIAVCLASDSPSCHGQDTPPAAKEPGDTPWIMHVIDDASRGADGVRLADINQDGLPDIATGWEEGGQIRICFHPGEANVREKWPSVCVGRVRSPEDAVPVDVNGDGLLDIVSCCEGNEQAVYVHLNPGLAAVQDSDQWTTQAIAPFTDASRWMYCLPVD
ncbi:MAG: VCBS repeat-containing protein, partial [Planctomycetaceae bacterium]|nr:VCBS repeat-containing protein [Planctomycetaceae bacterium]